MKFELDLTAEEMEKAQLEFLVNIFAMQKATAVTLIEAVAKDNEHAEGLIKLLNNEFIKERIEIFNHLYEKKGKINPNDLFSQK